VNSKKEEELTEAKITKGLGCLFGFDSDNSIWLSMVSWYFGAGPGLHSWNETMVDGEELGPSKNTKPNLLVKRTEMNGRSR
jgi:hypothetical protein